MNKKVHVKGGVLGFAIIIILAGAASALAADACSLLTKAEIQAALGPNVNVSDGKLSTTAPKAAAPCDYVIGSGAINILSRSLSPRDTADKMIAQYQKMKMPVTEVSGIGDRSFFMKPGVGIQLHAIKGTKHVILTIMLPNVSEEASKTAAENLMRKALTRI